MKIVANGRLSRAHNNESVEPQLARYGRWRPLIDGGQPGYLVFCLVIHQQLQLHRLYGEPPPM